MAHASTTTISLEPLAPGINIVPVIAGGERDHGLHEGLDVYSAAQLSKGRTVTVIGTLTGITLVSSFSTGLLTVGLPRMASDLALAKNLLLWYVSLS